MKLTNLVFAIILLSTKTFAQVDLNFPSSTPISTTPYSCGYSLEWDGLFPLFISNLNPINYTSIPDAILNDKSLYLFKMLIGAAQVGDSDTQFIIRIGGNSANKMWFIPSKFPPWTDVADISPVGFGHLALIQKISVLTGAKWIINIGLREINPMESYNPEFLAALYKYVNPINIFGIEMGNEPGI